MNGARSRLGLSSWIVLGMAALAAACVLSGLLPAQDARALGARTAPVLGFAVAITIVAELARDASVFEVLAQLLGRWGRRRVVVLWVWVVLLAVVSTVFLSLDTTAVILTPLVVLLAQSIRIPPLPFALATIWLANTASLLLPVSNLTNLLAAPAIGDHPFAFLALSWAPALVGVVVPVMILTLRYREVLFSTYQVPAQRVPSDPVLFWGAGLVLLVLLPLLAVTPHVWVPATAAVVVLVVLFLVRRRSALRPALVPWQALGLAASLFVLVETAHAHGLTALLTSVTGAGHGAGELLRVAGLGALAANGVNNLPAYLVLEPIAAGDPVVLMALLIGVNLGPLVTPWASLATLLWHQRVVALGVTFPWRRFAAWGLVAAVPTVSLAALALAIVGG
ncbi:SLC13 family permease [Promicromonospora sp. NPDC050880]|uniref:SLC13 family permease n=1 Tax=Promicromonospora sp. NPDC050880 TaxID=3364406 RepID=UPI00379668FB